MVDIDGVDRSLLLPKLRRLLDEIDKDSSISGLELMWQVRSRKCNQAEIPQAIFRVGDRLASVIFLPDTDVWELQLGGKERQFLSFAEACEWIDKIRTRGSQPFTVED